ncbi:RimJ/RimL family protein N-acetyltransferase [Novosphingobium kunmingense]|uniref:RimJ/RimL family protein N-acetyltransferase n=1 Tax=Novosphingobium kunmingense TaxID=1211806 RepID=A0A2N0H319_9SPHN|nr:GNAT family protein [Novosphingobium kunmingense]PKB13342.1 RimJ/RimL family protein N-acetyltransferase [Novosphingobium kunmingense]
MKDDPLGLLAVLEEGVLRLEPLEERHREALRAACAEDVTIWEMYGISYDPEHFDASFSALLANSERLPFAIMVAGNLAGMTAWIGTHVAWKTSEIGNTYLRPRHRGGQINGPLKRMMLAHGFACGLKRMFFSVDTRNERSQAACRKIGATFEGVLRNHMITWTGYLRDSAIFSVVERDRERLGL